MIDWLTQNVLQASFSIPEDAQGYCIGRGIPSAIFQEMQVGVWEVAPTASPSEDFNHRYGPHGERLVGWLSFPMWSPRGRLLGVEFRRWDGTKGVQKYFLPEVEWNPVFGGLVPSTFHKVWAGADVWLVEGVFDLALSHIVPKKDAVLACSGAKITPQQTTFLKRFLRPRSRVHVCFDMDATGQNMANGYTHPETQRHVWGVVERLKKIGVEARSIQYQGGKDPSEIWESGGRERLRHFFNL
jgi:DNA primase